MLKKIFVFLFINHILCIFIADAMAFDPETVAFSQRGTITTWLSTNFRGDFEELQFNVAQSLPQNHESKSNFCLEVTNDPGVQRYFGKTFPTIAAIELPFLQQVHEISKHKRPNTLEIAASMGLVSWKVPYAFEHGGTHYANELSLTEMNSHFDMIIDAFVSSDLKSSIVKIPGSCFNISTTHPELGESIDALYAQNLEHFFNPMEHYLFLELVADLLAPGGYAFLCAQSFRFGIDTTHPLRELYNRYKLGNVKYPGFAEYDMTFEQIVGSPFMVAGHATFENAGRPADNAVVEKRNIGMPRSLGLKHVVGFDNMQETQQITQHLMMNAFSPTIYRDAIKDHPRLEVVDAFFIDKDGVRQNVWGENITHAAVIVRKKTQTKLPSTSSTVNTKVSVERSVNIKPIDPSKSALLGATAVFGASSY